MYLKGAARLLKYRVRKARGFSLSEILITLTILAILGGMIMLAFGPSEDKARATRIAADLDALRSAVLTYSHEESWNKNAFDAAEGLDAKMVRIASISPYLDRSIDINFVVTKEGGRLLVGFQNHPRIEGGVPGKLASMANNAGLRNASGDLYSNGSSVYMFVR